MSQALYSPEQLDVNHHIARDTPIVPPRSQEPTIIPAVEQASTPLAATTSDPKSNGGIDQDQQSYYGALSPEVRRPHPNRKPLPQLLQRVPTSSSSPPAALNCVTTSPNHRETEHGGSSNLQRRRELVENTGDTKIGQDDLRASSDRDSGHENLFTSSENSTASDPMTLHPRSKEKLVDGLDPNNPWQAENIREDQKASASDENVGDKRQSGGRAGDARRPSQEVPIKMTANLSLVDGPLSEFSSVYHPTGPNPVQFLNERRQSEHVRPSVQMGSNLGFFENIPPNPSNKNMEGSPHRSNSPKVADSDHHSNELQLQEQHRHQSAGGVVGGSSSHDAGLSDLSGLGTAPLGAAERSHNSGLMPQHENAVRVTGSADMAKLSEQRNETYQIKHFNWFDYNRGTPRRSSMLTQNENGPCPLLALVNALILGVDDDSRSPLGAALRSREQVSLGLVIESLMDELTSEGRGSELVDLPDVDELNRFLLMLHTGMNANPMLAVPSSSSSNPMDTRSSSLQLPLSLNNDIKPGTFEDTREMRLYAAFAVPLVHGWISARSDPARAAFARSAKTYEDAQTMLFQEAELEEKSFRAGLSSDEQHLLQDLASIKTFLEKYPTQLTPHGLDVLNESLFPGAFAIFFRNSHFSTIYKHPESGVLYTLVTDAGYSDRDEIIWESLVDVNGQESEFFSGDFRPVGGAADKTATGASFSRDLEQHDRPVSFNRTQALPPLGGQPDSASSLLTPSQGEQEQTDADFAMALQLQEEERATQGHGSATQASSQSLTTNESGPTSSHSRGRDQRQPQWHSPRQQPLTSSSSFQRSHESSRFGMRPSIPPRGIRSSISNTNNHPSNIGPTTPDMATSSIGTHGVASRSPGIGVHRSSDDNNGHFQSQTRSTDHRGAEHPEFGPPPAYEEAARTRPYIPLRDHPQYASCDGHHGSSRRMASTSSSFSQQPPTNQASALSSCSAMGNSTSERGGRNRSRSSHASQRHAKPSYSSMLTSSGMRPGTSVDESPSMSSPQPLSPMATGTLKANSNAIGVGSSNSTTHNANSASAGLFAAGEAVGSALPGGPKDEKKKGKDKDCRVM